MLGVAAAARLLPGSSPDGFARLVCSCFATEILALQQESLQCSTVADIVQPLMLVSAL